MSRKENSITLFARRVQSGNPKGWFEQAERERHYFQQLK